MLLALLVCACAPAAAYADTIDASPLDLTADGQGGLQATFDGQTGPEFVPGQNGLWIRQNSTVTTPGKFTLIDKPVLSQPGAGQQRLTSHYRAGTDIDVTERLTSTDGEATARLEYTFKNLSAKAIGFSAAELGAVRAGGDGEGRGMLVSGPPRSVGGIDPAGRRVALQEQTAFSHYEVDDANTVRSAFTGGTLVDGVNSGFTTYAAAAQWDLSVEPGATAVVSVLWRFDPYETVRTVTTTEDHDDGTCDKTDCTLREAVEDLPAGTQTYLPAGTFTLPLGELQLDRSFVLIGAGADKTILDGGGTHRLLEVVGGVVDVYRVAFTHGHDAIEGGAIRVEENATLNLSESAVTDNSAQTSGGGIASFGVLNLTQSLVARNVATDAGGGGIVTIQRDGPASLSLENTTVSDNRAANGNGGGVYAGVPVSLNSTTIAGNAAFAGGGLYKYGDTPRTDRGLLAAGNTPSDCGGGSTFIDTKASLASDGSCGVAIGSANPRLGALADNGGATQTRALSPGSPAIDAGDPDSCPGIDQRGAVRDTGRCDIGAYEVPTDPLEPLGRVYGNPLDVTADGLGQLQLRLAGDNGGAFAPRDAEPANAGLAIVQNGTFYPPGSRGVVSGPIGTRTPVGGPIMTASAPGSRTLTSTYYVGSDLLVTESVTTLATTHVASLHYVIKNVASAPVSFRAGELAQLGRDAAGTVGASAATATDAHGGKVELVQDTAWDGVALGRDDENTDVYEAFVKAAIVTSAGQTSATNDQLGASWSVTGLAAGASKAIDVAWSVIEPTTETVVTTIADHVPDGCTPLDCTLREAVAIPGDAAVRVPAGTYTLTRGDLVLPQDMAIRGAGAGATTIVAAPASRGFDLAGSVVALSGVTVTGGNPAVNGVGTGEGGGIRVDFGASLYLADSVIRGNHATDGGGIDSLGPTTIERSSIFQNTATIFQDTFGGNGGGLLVRGGALALINSTVSGNSASEEGGGINTFDSNRVISVTVADNTAPLGSGFAHYTTTHHHVPAAAPVDDVFGADVRDTIIAGNHGGDECSGDIHLQSRYSLAGGGTCSFTGTGDLENADPKLGALTGGLHPLLAGSAALGAGGPVCPATSDQRGAVRAEVCDIGAYEASGGPVVTPTPTPTPTSTPAATATPEATATPQPFVDATPTPVPTAIAAATPTPVPPPVANQSVAAQTVRGVVLINAGGTFVPLTPSLLRNGSEVDARKGAVTITTATGEKATFYDGIFKLSQAGGITTLTLSEKLTGCTAKKASAAAAKPKTRKLWGEGKGKFRTKGQYSAATIRGTIWLTQDTCTTTVTKVKQGVIEVNDAVKHKKLIVKAGKSLYRAR